MKTLFLTLALLVVTTTVLLAQPGMPSAPDQAPIDGGLTMVALAGGAYALKKLKAKK
jgi:hypothetical protein